MGPGKVLTPNPGYKEHVVLPGEEYLGPKWGQARRVRDSAVNTGHDCTTADSSMARPAEQRAHLEMKAHVAVQTGMDANGRWSGSSQRRKHEYRCQFGLSVADGWPEGIGNPRKRYGKAPVNALRKQ